MSEHLYAVIMAGGGGTRLWPLSRQAHPKQMLKLFGERTMFQLAVDRLLPLLPLERICVVTGADQIAALAAQYPELPLENFIIEPQGRGTAPCIGLAAVHLQRRDPDAVMAVLTADHFIRREAHFCATLRAAQKVAEQGYLVTLGIEPTFPATGYGYVCRGAALGEVDALPYFVAARFTEKPNLDTALQFLQSGAYTWNSGMFIWRAAHILQEMQHWLPDLYATLMLLAAALPTPAYHAELQRLWPALKKETIDYGIMEKATRVAVIPAELGWSDIGAWDAVVTQHTPDADGNVCDGEVLTVATAKTMVLALGQRLVATIGVQDLVIVDTPDAILIAQRGQTEQVKEIVTRLQATGRQALL